MTRSTPMEPFREPIISAMEKRREKQSAGTGKQREQCPLLSGEEIDAKVFPVQRTIPVSPPRSSRHHHHISAEVTIL
ncbi:hypothetical protein GN956_G11097 [Arapaima gigas]